MKQWQFRQQLVEYASSGKPYTQQDIAVAAHVSEFQVSRWQRDHRFRQWVAAAYDEAFRPAAARAGLALLQHGARGNVQAFNAACDRGREWGLTPCAAPAAGPDGAQTPAGALASAVTHVHVHAIPEPASRSTLPPPLELPASSAVSSRPK